MSGTSKRAHSAPTHSGMTSEGGSADVADLCIALAELQAKRAHRMAAPPVPPASLEALAGALGRSLDAPAVLPELGFCTQESARRLEGARAALAASTTLSTRHAAWAALGSALAAAEQDALQLWSSVGLDNELAMVHESSRLWALAEEVADAARVCAESRPEAWPTFQPGDRATINGLGLRPELNGVPGSVRRFVAGKGRYAVQPDSGGPVLLLRPSNLLLRGDLPAAGHAVLSSVKTAVGWYEAFKRKGSEARRLRRLADETDAAGRRLCSALAGAAAVLQAGCAAGAVGEGAGAAPCVGVVMGDAAGALLSGGEVRAGGTDAVSYAGEAMGEGAGAGFGRGAARHPPEPMAARGPAGGGNAAVGCSRAEASGAGIDWAAALGGATDGGAASGADTGGGHASGADTGGGDACASAGGAGVQCRRGDVSWGAGGSAGRDTASSPSLPIDGPAASPPSPISALVDEISRHRLPPKPSKDGTTADISGTKHQTEPHGAV